MSQSTSSDEWDVLIVHPDGRTDCTTLPVKTVPNTRDDAFCGNIPDATQRPLWKDKSFDMRKVLRIIYKAIDENDNLDQKKKGVYYALFCMDPSRPKLQYLESGMPEHKVRGEVIFFKADGDDGKGIIPGKVDPAFWPMNNLDTPKGVGTLGQLVRGTITGILDDWRFVMDKDKINYEKPIRVAE